MLAPIPSWIATATPITWRGLHLLLGLCLLLCFVQSVFFFAHHELERQKQKSAF